MGDRSKLSFSTHKGGQFPIAPSRMTRRPREKSNGLLKKLLTMNSIAEYATNFVVILTIFALSSCGTVNSDPAEDLISLPTVTPASKPTFQKISTPKKDRKSVV